MSAALPPSTIHAAIADRLAEQYQRESGDFEPGPKRDNRRNHARRKYECWQLVAEFDGENLPLQRDFQLFRFHDISASGISFVAEERPLCNDLVIALGNLPFVFFHAQVVRAVSREDARLHIGCRFVKRLLGAEKDE